MKRRRALPWLIAAAAVIVAASLIRLARPGRSDPLADLRDTLLVVRTQVDSCRTELDQATSGMQELTARLDSMRARVREMESRDSRGVAADSYDVYIEAFDRYNESVPGWSERADTVRAQWTRCRDLTATHNTLADSLRTLLLRQMDAARQRR